MDRTARGHATRGRLRRLISRVRSGLRFTPGRTLPKIDRDGAGGRSADRLLSIYWIYLPHPSRPRCPRRSIPNRPVRSPRWWTSCSAAGPHRPCAPSTSAPATVRRAGAADHHDHTEGVYPAAAPSPGSPCRSCGSSRIRRPYAVLPAKTRLRGRVSVRVGYAFREREGGQAQPWNVTHIWFQCACWTEL
jgi:hypothetical protein